MARDGVEIPPIMEKCCAAIEKYGLESQGIYRISGMMTKIQRLKERLDRGMAKLVKNRRSCNLNPNSRHRLREPRRGRVVIRHQQCF